MKQIEPTPDNEVIISQVLKDKIDQALNKKKTFAEELVDSVEVRRIVWR